MSNRESAKSGGFGTSSLLFNNSEQELTNSARTQRGLWTTAPTPQHLTVHRVQPPPEPNKQSTPIQRKSKLASPQPSPTSMQDPPFGPACPHVELEQRIALLEMSMREREEREELRGKFFFNMLKLMGLSSTERPPASPLPHYFETPPPVGAMTTQQPISIEDLERIVVETVGAVQLEYARRLDAERVKFFTKAEERLQQIEATHYASAPPRCATVESLSVELVEDIAERVVMRRLDGLQRVVYNRLAGMEDTMAKWCQRMETERHHAFERSDEAKLCTRKVSGDQKPKEKTLEVGHKAFFNVTDVTYLVKMRAPKAAVENLLHVTAYLLEFPDVASMRQNTREAEMRMYRFSAAGLHASAALTRLEAFFAGTTFASIMNTCIEAVRVYQWVVDTAYRLRVMAWGEVADAPTGMPPRTPMPSSRSQESALEGTGGGSGAVCVCGNVLPWHLSQSPMPTQPSQRLAWQ